MLNSPDYTPLHDSRQRSLLACRVSKASGQEPENGWDGVGAITSLSTGVYSQTSA